MMQMLILIGEDYLKMMKGRWQVKSEIEQEGCKYDKKDEEDEERKSSKNFADTTMAENCSKIIKSTRGKKEG